VRTRDLVDEEEVYRYFGGYLPVVPITTEIPSHKARRQLFGQMKGYD